MHTLFYLYESQLGRIKPFFLRSHAVPRVDDRRVVKRHHIRHQARTSVELLTKGQVTTIKVQPFSSTSSPITVRFWQIEAIMRVGCGNLWEPKG